jgi:D-alanyl-D-alanine carboxypeptidase
VFEALEKGSLSLEHRLTISENAQDIGKVNKINTLNLKAGDHITVENALKGMLVKSFNESAVALAEAIAGDEWSFAQMLNKKAAELQMNHTNFRNASGLHEDGHYTTNYDLARLVNALEKKFPQYRKYFSLQEFVYNGAKYKNTNHILLEYKGADGFKTGFTNAAGFNLIASAKQDGKRVNAILTGCESYQKRDEFMKALLDDGFKQIEHRNSDSIVVLK